MEMLLNFVFIISYASNMQPAVTKTVMFAFFFFSLSPLVDHLREIFESAE